MGGGTLFVASGGVMATKHRFKLDLPARPGKRRARQARLDVRFGRLRVCRPTSCSDPNAPRELDLFAIEVREINPPAGETPILWRLLTTHAVNTTAQALTVIGWYRQRWHIEQLFRTVKRQGIGLEQSVVEDGTALEKLAVIALVGATMTMQLVLVRAAANLDEHASHVFDARQIAVLDARCKHDCKAAPANKKNPYPSTSLAWAAWTIARPGGWSGYESERSTGPITMRDGLERFNAIVQRLLPQ